MVKRARRFRQQAHLVKHLHNGRLGLPARDSRLVLTSLLCVFYCSFFEKISTGSNTDSDLRVVRFDTNSGLVKEREIGDNQGGDGFNELNYDDEDALPKFRKPIPSKHQLTQQMYASRASQQRRIQQQQ